LNQRERKQLANCEFNIEFVFVHTLLICGCSNRGGWDGPRGYHTRDIWKIHTRRDFENL